jgi:hypothetical protein
VRFWDPATQSAAAVPLDVQAYPDAAPERLTKAVQGRSGAYSFRGLPGLRNVETSAGDDDFWASNAIHIPYTVVVNDPTNTYLPFQFSLRLPNRGFYGLAGSPLDTTLVPDATWLPIFSSPARTTPDGMGVVRGLLMDSVSGGPAAWALVRLDGPNMTPAVGLTDARGVISLLFLYPEPRNFALGSPLRSGGLRLTDQTWVLNLSVQYKPGRASEITPDLDGTLQQVPAICDVPAITVQFGKEFILRSLDSVSGRELSALLITAAGSPL